MSGQEFYNVSEGDLDKFNDAIHELVEKAGEMVRNAIEKEKKIMEKDSAVDLVTETDKAVEKLLTEGIKSRFPDHCFIGEESTAENGVMADFTVKPTWIIDPIDGTMNFVHSNPMVSISVALAVNRKIQIGIVSLPIMNKVYSARRGKGAKMNGKDIKTSGCNLLEKSMVLYELWAMSDQGVMDKQVDTVRGLMYKVQAVRSIGSAAINLAFVAGGQADAYFHVGIHCWDIAAGALIVHEAGGYVCDPSGGEFDYMSRGIMVASTEKLAKELLELGLKQVEMGREYRDPCPL